MLRRPSHNYVHCSPLFVLHNIRQTDGTPVFGKPTTLSTGNTDLKWPQTGISTGAATATEARGNRQRCPVWDLGSMTHTPVTNNGHFTCPTLPTSLRSLHFSQLGVKRFLKGS